MAFSLYVVILALSHLGNESNHASGHIEWHLQSGLALQLIEAPLRAQTAAAITFPPILNSHCAALNIPYTGNAAGHNSTTDLTGLHVGPFPQVLGWKPKGIVAMTACVLSAILGMASVCWYVMSGAVDDEKEVERQVRERMELKAQKKREGGSGLFGYGKEKSGQ